MATANLSARSTRATGIARLSAPWPETFAFGLAKPVDATLPVLAAHLRVETLRTRLSTVLADMTEGTPTMSFLCLAVEEARTAARAASLATVEEAWAAYHALGTSAATSALTLGRVHGTLAGAKEGRSMLCEGCVLAEGLETCATTATLVGVVTDVQVVPVVTHKELGLVECLERDRSAIRETRPHTEGHLCEGVAPGLLEMHACALMAQVVTLPVCGLK